MCISYRMILSIVVANVGLRKDRLRKTITAVLANSISFPFLESRILVIQTSMHQIFQSNCFRVVVYCSLLPTTVCLVKLSGDKLNPHLVSAVRSMGPLCWHRGASDATQSGKKHVFISQKNVAWKCQYSATSSRMLMVSKQPSNQHSIQISVMKKHWNKSMRSLWCFM